MDMGDRHTPAWRGDQKQRRKRLVKRDLAAFKHSANRDRELPPAARVIALIETTPVRAPTKPRNPVLISVAAAVRTDNSLLPNPRLEPRPGVALAFKDLATRKIGRAPAHGSAVQWL